MLLSREEVDVTVVSYDQETTALHYAASKNYVEIAKMLLLKDAVVADAEYGVHIFTDFAHAV